MKKKYRRTKEKNIEKSLYKKRSKNDRRKIEKKE